MGQLSLLWEQHPEVCIPPAVWNELCALRQPQALVALHEALAKGHLRVLGLSSRSVADALLDDLDPGEAEAIALASELKADLLLMDERDGRLAARRLGLRVKGVLGILKEARLAGKIASLKPEMERLRVEAHFFISPSLESEFLRSVEEGP